MDLVELQKIFEYELKRKLAQRCRTKNEELRFLLNSFKFYDYQTTLLIDKNKWIKGVLKTGLSGFNINDLSDVFNKYDLNNTGYINYKNFCYYLYGKEDFLPLSKNYLDNNSELISDIYSNRLKSPFNDFKPPGLYERNFQMLENENRFNSRKTPSINNLKEISKNNNNFNNNNIKNSLNKDYYYELLQKQSPNTPFQNYSNINKNINNDNNKNNSSNLNSYKNNLEIQKFSTSFENESHFKKLLLLLQSKINTDNGVTYYAFAQKLKLHENQIEKTITLNSFYSTLRDINISFRLNDLTDLFNYIDKSKSNNVPTETILQLIKGNLNEKRKIIIEYSYSLIDKDKMGRVPLDIIKSSYNCKLHPDVYVGLKQEEDIYKEFCYTFDVYCSLYNVKEYINCEQFIDYYWGISASIIDDNYFEDILNGVWNNNIKSNKNLNSLINDNLNIQKNSNENYRKELIGNTINNSSNYFLNNRYVNNPNVNENVFKYINYQNNSNSNSDSNINLLKNNNQQNSYLSPYTPIPKENEYNHDRVTPYYHPVKTPLYKGVKTFRSLRHNPITNEFIMNKEVPIDGYYESSPIKNLYNNDKYIRNNYENKNNNNSLSEKPIKELEQFREIIISRGQKGIFIFQKILNLYDKEKKGEITYNNFNEVLEMFNIIMNKNSINYIFEYFDKEKSGVIKYDNLINELIGNININREMIIKNVFDSFSKDTNNKISIKYLKQRYKACNHPDVINKNKTEREIYYDFIESIDIFKNYRLHLQGQNYYDDLLSYQEFLDYYKEISMSIKDDKLFEEILFNCWNITKEKSVYNNEENNKINSYEESNLRINTANQILNNKGYY